MLYRIKCKQDDGRKYEKKYEFSAGWTPPIPEVGHLIICEGEQIQIVKRVEWYLDKDEIHVICNE